MKKEITALEIQYLHICRRKLWLYKNQIGMEHTSDVVADGTFIHKNTYLQRNKNFVELDIPGGKIDFFDPNKKIVHETKRSDKMAFAQRAQIIYYLYQLRKLGIEASACIEQPTMRTKEMLFWTVKDEDRITLWKKEIDEISKLEIAPDKREFSFCKACAYCDFCWALES